jgi:hypothetical protein
MKEELAKSIKDKFGYGGELTPLDNVYVPIKPTVSTTECLQVFNEMTEEVFRLYGNLFVEQKLTLMVHVGFPDGKTVLYPTEGVPINAVVEPNPAWTGASLAIPDSIELQSGKLERIHIDYDNFGTHYDFYYFMPNNHKKYEQWLKDKLSQDGLTLQHEWYFTFTPPGARMGKHCDVLGPNLRYSFAVKQPVTDRSITIDDVHYYIPENTAYILDGRVPHEIIQDADSPRLMLLGALTVGSLD